MSPPLIIPRTRLIACSLVDQLCSVSLPWANTSEWLYVTRVLTLPRTVSPFWQTHFRGHGSRQPTKEQNVRQRNNSQDGNTLTYTLRISARLVPPVKELPVPPPPEASVGVGETTPARLGGLEGTLGPVFPRLVVRTRATTLGPGVDPDPLEGVFPNSARLGGTYSFFPPD